MAEVQATGAANATASNAMSDLGKANARAIDTANIKKELEKNFSLYSSDSDVIDSMSNILTNPDFANVPEQLRMEMVQLYTGRRTQFQAFVTNMLKQMQDMAMQVIQNMRS